MSTEPSKSAAKTAKTDAGKAAKKRPDPAGLALIEAGDKAMAEKDFAKAIDLFGQAKKVCEASTIEAAPKEKKAKPPPAPAVASDAAAPAAAEEEEKKPRLMLKTPVENLQAKPLRDGVDAENNYALNSEERLKAHLKQTGGGFRTRFPPEPNGYLHIGHAKAMNFNFGQARIARDMGCGGETVMRFDDTNPTAEKQEFIDSILDNVSWLGHTPSKVTYSSDYFQELYELAFQLIKAGGAFVCHQTAAEIKASRDLLKAYHAKRRELPADAPMPPLPPGAMSPFRHRAVDENLRLFERMRQGRFAEGEAFLRMKTDLLSVNTALWDPAAYRIMFHPHPRTGDEWCIYPTYDYTHCIVDSLENITHSLCTLEFEVRQACDGPYYWLLHKLQLYKPATWEYSRLNLTHSLMSKRKLKHLVTFGHVAGWDDPRLVTLDGMRRRGFAASVINRFCEAIGVTRSRMTARVGLLEQFARQEMDVVAPRRFAVLQPLKVTISRGLPKGGIRFSAANHPKDESMGTRELQLLSPFYIEAGDFREVDDSKYYGMAPGKEVGLLGAGVNIKCEEVERDAGGNVVGIVASLDATAERTKVKGHLHWVSAPTAVSAEIRVYDVLFTPEMPEEEAAALRASASSGFNGAGAGAVEEEEEEEEEEEAADSSKEPDWVTLLNPHSLVVYQGLVEPALAAAAGPPSRSSSRPTFQFQRSGYFCVDSDSTLERPIFNRVVALKEDKEKKAIAR